MLHMQTPTRPSIHSYNSFIHPPIHPKTRAHTHLHVQRPLHTNLYKCLYRCQHTHIASHGFAYENVCANTCNMYVHVCNVHVQMHFYFRYIYNIYGLVSAKTSTNIHTSKQAQRDKHHCSLYFIFVHIHIYSSCIYVTWHRYINTGHTIIIHTCMRACMNNYEYILAHILAPSHPLPCLPSNLPACPQTCIQVVLLQLFF